MKHSHSTWRIIAKNTFTLFNLVNLILALMVAFVGSYKNILFIGVAIANTLISIINGLRAQRIVNRLKLLSEKRPVILKNGQPTEVKPEEVAAGDILILTLGDQIGFDSVLMDDTLEVNEAFITGEQDNITKHPGDQLTSGSFVVAGSAKAKVTHALADNFISKLQSEASNIKTADSQLFKLMNNIVKYISYALVPIGALLLWARFRTEADTATAVTSTVAALINMIPEGLILLTSSILALATIRLGRKKVLVQDLYAIETLARVDTICLDKTGTLTTGQMAVHDYTQFEKSFLKALKAILTHQTSKNATNTALMAKFARVPDFKATSEIRKIDEVYPFSSDRKFSGVRVGSTVYLMGAIEFITSDKDIIHKVKQASDSYRTLAVVKLSGHLKTGFEESVGGHDRDRRSVPPITIGRRDSVSEKPVLDIPDHTTVMMNDVASLTDGLANKVELLGIIRLEDEIRPTAKGIIKYFYDNNIDITIISGDDLAAVTTIAEQVGVKNLRGIDLTTSKTHDYAKLVKDYSIFTRVTPAEKKDLIRALRADQRTVAMTGDGVNDILAMKEADASLAIGEGSDAARRTAKFVLLDSGFEAIPAIIDEGRQSINNLERSTSLFLAKTVYASLLAVLFVILPLNYPYTPIEMTLINFACIGFPGLVLALEHNTARIKNQFISNIKHYSIPTGIIVAVSMLILSIVAEFTNMDKSLLTTLSATITSAIGIVLIYQISRPLNLFRTILLVIIIALLVTAFLLPLSRSFFEFI